MSQEDSERRPSSPEGRAPEKDRSSSGEGPAQEERSREYGTGEGRPDEGSSRESASQDESLLPSSLPSFRREMIGGVIAGVVFLAGTISAGQVSGVEAKLLLQSMIPTARFLYSGIITASATILALMLTLLSLSINTTSELEAGHYHRVRTIALIDTITFVAAMTLLVFLIVPLEEPKSIVPHWYEIFYYVTIGGSSVLGGLLVTVVLMLYSTVRDIIAIFGFGRDDHPLVVDDES